jgi:hypothetical protein
LGSWTGVSLINGLAVKIGVRPPHNFKGLLSDCKNDQQQQRHHSTKRNDHTRSPPLIFTWSISATTTVLDCLMGGRCDST